MSIPSGWCNRNQVVYLADHTPDFGGISQHTAAGDAAQTQAANRLPGRLLGTDDGTYEGNLDLFLSHDYYPRISSTVLPRLAAISAGVAQSRRPLSVGRTRLYGLLEPRLLATTLRTPMTSKMARMGPPAMTPVPSEAGEIRTRDAPCGPTTA